MERTFVFNGFTGLIRAAARLDLGVYQLPLRNVIALWNSLHISQDFQPLSQIWEPWSPRRHKTISRQEATSGGLLEVS